MDKLGEYLARVGFHGFLGLAVVLAVVFVGVYGFVYRPDHIITADIIEAVKLAFAGIMGAAIMAFKSGPAK